MGSILILTVLILPIQEHWYIFPSVCVMLDLFHQHCTLFRGQVFCLLRWFIPRYFILLVVVLNEIVSLISLSDLSFLMYRSATWASGVILRSGYFSQIIGRLPA